MKQAKITVLLSWIFTGFLSCTLISSNAFSQVRVEKNLELRSAILNESVSVTVILPAEYDAGKTAYPVVYLLHGFGGDQNSWITRCRVNFLIDSLLQNDAIGECIYILPDAGNTYFVNRYDGRYNYTDFFMAELVPWVDSVYRTIPEKSARALLGLSMGGYGSILLGLKFPDTFGTVVALSSAVRDAELFKSLPVKKYENNFGPVFGPGLSGEERITQHWMDNSPYFLIDSLTAINCYTLNWYIDCGLSDFLLPANEAFHELLMQYRIPHEFHIRPGAHNWDYWYSSTVNGLIFIDEIFKYIRN